MFLLHRIMSPFHVFDGDDPGGSTPPTPDPTPTPAPTPEPTPPPAPDDAAFARMRREKEAAEARAKEAEDKLAEEARKKAEEEGRWKELAEQEKARADQLEARQREDEQKRLAERAATDLKFKDPGYALYRLAQDNVDLSDPPAVKAALEQLAASNADLVSGNAPPAPTGGPSGGNQPDPPGLTREALAAMTPKQIAALDPEVVNKALTA